MNLTKAQLDELLRSNPALSLEVRPPQQKPAARVPLARPATREGPSPLRFAIRFEIFATRPADWDNPWTKALQDALRYAGILHEDSWNVLEGSVASRKVYRSKEKNSQEKTVITISRLNPEEPNESH